MKRELEANGKNCRRKAKLTALPVDRTALVASENWQTSTLHKCFISQVNLAVELATMRIIGDGGGVIKVFVTKTLVARTRLGDELFTLAVLLPSDVARRQRLPLLFICSTKTIFC